MGYTVNQICRAALDNFGSEAQIDMCIEECAELINALEKYRRGRVSKAEVITEIADVQIMCEQMQELFGDEETNKERMRKWNRLVERMEKRGIIIKRMEL